MFYKVLPDKVTLPDLRLDLTGACSSRRGATPSILFIHRWGIGDWRHENIDGIRNTFRNPANEASSHFIYGGEVGHDIGECYQMVRVADKSWTEGMLNPWGISIECADAMWLGKDPIGFARTARISAFLCKKYHLRPVWVHGAHMLNHDATGVARHADGGRIAGGHTECPTTDMDLWHQFIGRVAKEYKKDGFRPTGKWGV